MLGKKLALATLALASSLSFAGDFILQSDTVKPEGFLTNQQVYKGFGCSGENTSPDLSWSAGPEGTKSYALTVYAPDAPTGSGWWHWMVYNIPGDVTELKAGAGGIDGKLLPEGAAHGPNDFSRKEFGGPCPPKGDKPHRYIFTVHALKVDEIKYRKTLQPP